MPNTLTNLIPDAYAALDVVSRELVGFIPSVTRDASADRIAVGQTLRSPLIPASSASDVTAAMSLPAAAYQTIANKSLTISKSRQVSFSWTGEEIKGLDAGPGSQNIVQGQFAQAMRALVNEMESDVAVAAYKGASRAYGTAGTTAFASTLADPAQLRKILDDNGAPLSDRSLVIDTTAGAAMRTLAQLTKANEAADSSLLRQGVLLDIHGFAIRESAQVPTVTKGTGASYLVNNASGYSIGDTAITLDGGTGTILAGDVITFAGDTNKYVVETALASNVVTIAAPGLKKALADNAALTVGNNFAANVGFSRDAIVLANRLPALPAAGDLAVDRTVVSDPRSGLAFEVAVYPGYRMVTYVVSAAWGVSVVKPNHIGILLG
jgi:hypothetical protein